MGAGAVALAFAPTAWAQSDEQFRQKNVDDLITRIDKAVGTSLETADWRRNYAQAARNIEDLAKVLRYGGKIHANPVAAFKAKLDALWQERREWLTYLEGTVVRLQRLSESASQQAIRDVGGAMIRFLMKPVPGGTTLLNAARTRDADVIRQDFARLKTQKQAIKVTREYITQLLKNMTDLKQRRMELEPLSAAFAALSQSGTASQATYVGKVTWRQNNLTRELGGSIKLIVTGQQVSGEITVIDKGAVRKAAITGEVGAGGRITAKVAGKSATAAGNSGIAGILVGALLNFPFRGMLTGTVVGNSAGGSFQVGSVDKRKQPVSVTGKWQASKS